MPDDLMRELKDIVETWNIEKAAGREFTGADMRAFVTRMNALTRRLISCIGYNDVEFYIGLNELAQHATTVVTQKARVIANGVDMTNV